MHKPKPDEPAKKESKSFWQKFLPSRFKSGVKDGKSDMDNLKKEVDIDEHKLTVDELCRRYATSITTGLTDQVAAELLIKNGPNALTPPKQTPKYIKFLRCMLTGFSKLLWVAAFFCFISYGISISQDPATPLDNVWLGVALVVVIVGTGCFQFYQENKSDNIMESFKKMIPQEGKQQKKNMKIKSNHV